MDAKVVFCTNLEVIFDNRLDSGLDQQNTEWQREVIADAIQAACRLLPEGCEDENSSWFADWNGGKYASQADRFGYKTLGHFAYRGLSPEAAAPICAAFDQVIDTAIEEANRQEAEYQAEVAKEAAEDN